jgi:beta-aspartyl-peptidase (threonine type)
MKTLGPRTRISPVIGAGTYADNDGVAVSATGQGEFFIRAGVGHEINSRYRYQKLSLQQAVDSVVQTTLVKMGGEGGVISLNKKGEVAFSYNTGKKYPMYRGYITKAGKTTVLLTP